MPRNSPSADVVNSYNLCQEYTVCGTPVNQHSHLTAPTNPDVERSGGHFSQIAGIRYIASLKRTLEAGFPVEFASFSTERQCICSGHPACSSRGSPNGRPSLEENTFASLMGGKLTQEVRRLVLSFGLV